MKQIHIIAFTQEGMRLALMLRTQLEAILFDVTVSSAARSGCGIPAVSLGGWVQEHFMSGNALVYIGAAGIAVRSIAPFVKDKRSDPAVLVLDEKGRFVVPLLSGHIGGANELARQLARMTGGLAVLTTASDVNGLFAVDVCARKNHCAISSMEKAKRFAAALLKHRRGFVLLPEDFADCISVGSVPPELSIVSADDEAAGTAGDALFCISPAAESGLLQLVPSCLLVGVGCKRNTPAASLRNFVAAVLEEQGLHPAAIAAITSIDVKTDEPAVKELASFYHVPPLFFSAETLRAVPGSFLPSEFVRQTVGVDNVCERSAVAAGASRLLVRKIARDGMTAAVGIRHVHISLA